MHGRAPIEPPIEHVIGTPLLQVFGMLFILYIKGAITPDDAITELR